MIKIGDILTSKCTFTYARKKFKQGEYVVQNIGKPGNYYMIAKNHYKLFNQCKF